MQTAWKVSPLRFPEGWCSPSHNSFVDTPDWESHNCGHVTEADQISGHGGGADTGPDLPDCSDRPGSLRRGADAYGSGNHGPCRTHGHNCSFTDARAYHRGAIGGDPGSD